MNEFIIATKAKNSSISINSLVKENSLLSVPLAKDSTLSILKDSTLSIRKDSTFSIPKESIVPKEEYIDISMELDIPEVESEALIQIINYLEHYKNIEPTKIFRPIPMEMKKT